MNIGKPPLNNWPSHRVDRMYRLCRHPSIVCRSSTSYMCIFSSTFPIGIGKALSFSTRSEYTKKQQQHHNHRPTGAAHLYISNPKLSGQTLGDRPTDRQLNRHRGNNSRAKSTLVRALYVTYGTSRATRHTRRRRQPASDRDTPASVVAPTTSTAAGKVFTFFRKDVAGVFRRGWLSD